MKKKISEMTIDEIIAICGKHERCENCPLNVRTYWMGGLDHEYKFCDPISISKQAYDKYKGKEIEYGE